MGYFILGVGALVALLLLARWIANADPRLLAWTVKVAGGVALLIIGVVLFVSDRLQWLMYLVPLALPVYFQWRSNRMRRRNAQGPAPGGRSDVNTGWLRMELDHDSGAMRGAVLRGRFAGRGLAGMSLDELRELLDEVGADPDSVGVLEAYLDRVHGPGWRGGAADEGTGAGSSREGGSGRAGLSGMTEPEALEILGLGPNAGVDDIKEAHRRLMAKLHPDRGGSTYLAAKINQAKDTLLKRR
ncbi:MAG: molecular chaperone DnaJ [Alphaproteobacteria bacterium]|nr:molecular chaperone DnaJ [Alphaproteobacteria bacterium]